MVYINNGELDWSCFKLLCDGVEIKDWFAADDELNFAVRYVNGARNIKPVFGKIEIEENGESLLRDTPRAKHTRRPL